MRQGDKVYLGSIRFFKHVTLVILCLLFLGLIILTIQANIKSNELNKQLTQSLAESVIQSSAIFKATEDPKEYAAYAWIKDNHLFAHGLGEINGVATTNSLEAFQASYDKGFKVFESDLLLTSEGDLVLAHDNWRFITNVDGSISKIDSPISYEAFRMMQQGEGLTTLSFEEMAKLMVENKDVRIITDTKETNPAAVKAQFDAMMTIINKYDKNLIKRITPQFYDEAMYYQLKKDYKFESYIYTLYMSPDSNETVLNFMTKNGIKILTMPETMITQKFLTDIVGNGIYACTHTINSVKLYDKYRKMGVYGFYTDSLM